MSFLKIKNLSVDYQMRKETVYAAKNINIEVNKGEILGEGFHQKYGQSHAEVNAINAVGRMI